MPLVCILIPHQVPTLIILWDLTFFIPYIWAPWDPTTQSGTCVLLFEESTPCINPFKSDSDGPPPAPSQAPIAQVASIATIPSIIWLPPSTPISYPAPLSALQPGLNFLHHPEPDYAGQLAAILNQVAAQAEEVLYLPTSIPFKHLYIEHLTDTKEPDTEDLGYPYDEKADELQSLSCHLNLLSTPPSLSLVVSPLILDLLFLHNDSEASLNDLPSPPPYNLCPQPIGRSQLALLLSTPTLVKRRHAACQAHHHPLPALPHHFPIIWTLNSTT
ncbi:hypothetical protein C2E23DRAFT_885941 [Lenzites betulinus]|nr:hypothetical protein C2E23DRAFT_885941 [Lenzites betulinus]